MNSVQRTVLRYAPVSIQNLALSVRGYQIARSRYTRHFRRRLADLEGTAAAPLDELYEIQRTRLADRVDFARRHTRTFRDVPPVPRDGDAQETIARALSEIPPFDKVGYVEDPEAYLGAGLDRSKLFVNNTSGTTGTPLRLWHTREALAEEYATVWRLYRSRGVAFDDPRLTFGGNVVVPYDADSPPFWRHNRYGRQILFSSYHMKPENLGIYVNAVHRLPARWVQGYPSVLYVMARALLDAGRPLPRHRLVGVFTSSERLLAFHRERIEEAFQAPVVDRYGTSEFAVSMTGCAAGRMHVDMEFCIVEVEPVEEDEDTVRGPIRVTGLAPDAIPFLRYRIGDVGVRSKRSCPCGRPGETFLEIEGREDDYVVTRDGRWVGRLDHVFKGQARIVEAQILQDAPGAITVRLVPRLGFGEDDERALRGAVAERLGWDMEIRFERVREIPRDANGKFRAVKSRVGRPA